MKSFKTIINEKEEIMTFKKDDLNATKELKMISAKKRPIIVQCCKMKEPFKVETLEGMMNGKKGDYLMVGVDGEMYPCDSDIFDKTYDIVED